MNGQLALPGGTVAINANLTQTGPDGQFVLAVPGQFAQSLSISNGSVASSTCAVVGPQQVTVSAGRGAGVRVDFHPSDAAACPVPGTVAEALVMAPVPGTGQA